MNAKNDNIDMLQLMLARDGKEISSAKPIHRYRDPAQQVQLPREEERKRKADALLEEWHAWSAAYRPALGIPGCSPSSRQAQSSKQWQSTYEIADEFARKAEMEAVEWCVDALKFQYRQAIGVEMRNRSAKAKVWRGPTLDPNAYREALEDLLPILRRRGLLD